MKERYYSLDVFRGATVATMILVNNPGSWSHLYAPLAHAPWHGATPTDLVFPFFLFAVGNAMAFVMPRLEAAGEGSFWYKVVKRTVLIFLIGVFLNWFPFIKYNEAGELTGRPFDTLRIFGVLQRIALAYFFASVIVHYGKVRGAFVTGGIILMGYWLLCVLANPVDPYSLQGWFGTRIDLAILGDKHVYHGEGVAFDPEGIMSTFAAIVQVILGYITGNYILQKGKTPEMLNGLFVAGCVLVFTGLCWDMVFPINKKIWTSSFTVYTTGLALLVLAVLIHAIEFTGRRGVWSRFFDVFGKNALFIFALSAMLSRFMALIRVPIGLNAEGRTVYLSPLSWYYQYVCKLVLPSDPRIGSFIYALTFLALMWLLAWLLDKNRIYIKV